jgi:hypothetical protein
MIKSGTLYWYTGVPGKKQVEMLIETKALSLKKQIVDENKYEHTLLGDSGNIFTLRGRTEDIAKDPFWSYTYERIEL